MVQNGEIKEFIDEIENNEPVSLYLRKLYKYNETSIRLDKIHK